MAITCVRDGVTTAEEEMWLLLEKAVNPTDTKKIRVNLTKPYLTCMSERVSSPKNQDRCLGTSLNAVSYFLHGLFQVAGPCVVWVTWRGDVSEWGAAGGVTAVSCAGLWCLLLQ